MLNSELLHPNRPVSGRANRLKKAVAEVNRLWIQTPAKTRQRVAFVIFMVPPYCCRVPRSSPRSRPLNLPADRLVPSQ